jgi:hypothetical protein
MRLDHHRGPLHTVSDVYPVRELRGGPERCPEVPGASWRSPEAQAAWAVNLSPVCSVSTRASCSCSAARG